MSPRHVGETVHRDVPLITHDQPVGSAVQTLLETGLPALPVVDDAGRLVGIFGEREFMTALFPGYVGTLGSAGFVPRSLESVLEKREHCSRETVRQHMNTEHVEVDQEFSDLGLAEIFLHHRVLIIPVVDGDHRPEGVITRADFFRVLAEKFLAEPRKL